MTSDQDETRERRTYAGLCNHNWYQAQVTTYSNISGEWITITEFCDNCAADRTTHEQKLKKKAQVNP